MLQVLSHRICRHVEYGAVFAFRSFITLPRESSFRAPHCGQGLDIVAALAFALKTKLLNLTLKNNHDNSCYPFWLAVHNVHQSEGKVYLGVVFAEASAHLSSRTEVHDLSYNLHSYVHLNVGGIIAEAEP